MSANSDVVASAKQSSQVLEGILGGLSKISIAQRDLQGLAVVFDVEKSQQFSAEAYPSYPSRNL